MCKCENLRPSVPADACIPELYSLMVRCWSSNPDDRIDFYLMKCEMKTVMKSLGLNSSLSANSTLTENLLVRMEQYASDLEMIVKQRTNELAEEKKKTEELLYQILPKYLKQINLYVKLFVYLCFRILIGQLQIN